MTLTPGMKFRFKTWPERWKDHPKQLRMVFEIARFKRDIWWELQNPPHRGAHLRSDDTIEVVNMTEDPPPRFDLSAKLHDVTKDRDALRNALSDFKKSFHNAGLLGEWHGWKVYEHKGKCKPRFGAYKDGRQDLKSDDFQRIMDRIHKAEAPPPTSEFTWNDWSVSRDPLKVHGLKACKAYQTFWRKDMAALLDAMIEHDNGGDGTTAKEYRKRWHDVCEGFRKVTNEEFDPKAAYAPHSANGPWDRLGKAEKRIKELEETADQPVVRRQIHTVNGNRCTYLGLNGGIATAFVNPNSRVKPGEYAYIWFHFWGDETHRVAQQQEAFLSVDVGYLRNNNNTQPADTHEATVTSIGLRNICWAEGPTETYRVTGVPGKVRKGDRIEITATNDTWLFLELLDRKETPVSDPTKVGLLMRGLKSSPKYLGFLLAFSILSSPIENYNSAKEFFTAPSALETGKWTRVTACDGCDKVTDVENAETANLDTVCPDCGGETFSDRKAKKLMQDSILPWRDATVRGYQFADGDVTVDPGTEFPEGDK